MDKHLTVDEDAELRRLAALAAFGELGHVAAALYAELRARDRRATIRDPADLVEPTHSLVSDDNLVSQP